MTNAVNLASAAGTGFFRNRIINGDMRIDQRNGGASVNSGGSIIYCVDRWWFGSNGASSTAQRVAGSGSTQNLLRITGAASITSMLCGQRIEAANSFDLAGSTVTLSFDMANSLLTSASWALSYANSTDSFGTLPSPTITQIASGTVNITSTVTRYSVQITLPAAATTGLQVQFGVSAQTSGTWTIGNVQLEAGSVATPFERRQYGQELALCQRYYEKSYDANILPGTATSTGRAATPTNANASSLYVEACVKYNVTKRTQPTIRFWDVAGNLSRVTDLTGGGLSPTNGRNSVWGINSGDSGFGLICVQNPLTFSQFQWDASAEL